MVFARARSTGASWVSHAEEDVFEVHVRLFKRDGDLVEGVGVLFQELRLFLLRLPKSTLPISLKRGSSSAPDRPKMAMETAERARAFGSAPIFVPIAWNCWSGFSFIRSVMLMLIELQRRGDRAAGLRGR